MRTFKEFHLKLHIIQNNSNSKRFPQTCNCLCLYSILSKIEPESERQRKIYKWRNEETKQTNEKRKRKIRSVAVKLIIGLRRVEYAICYLCIISFYFILTQSH